MATEIIKGLNRYLTRCKIALAVSLVGNIILAIALIIR